MLPTYEIKFEEGKVDGVFGISLVEDPAIQSNFIALSKQQKIQLSTIDNEKRILLGAVLVPDLPIYRNQNGMEFNIVFSADTIRKSMENFFKQSYQQNSSLEHDQEIDGVTFVESWIKEDDVHDKSVVYGINEPNGTWFATMKVDNDEIWNDYVKTGQVKGFSIDGMFDLEKINLNNAMNLESITNAIKEGFEAILSNKQEEVVVELAQIKLIDGVTILEAESFEAGMPVFVVAENGDKVPAPIGEHELEDGKILIITEEGMIAEIKEKVEEVVEEESADVEMNADETQKFVDMIREMFTQFSKQVANEIEAIKVEMKAEIESAKSTKEIKPSAKVTPEVKNDVTIAMTKKERILSNIKNLQ
jgi:polyhydroxyalkanoate synthesis regulator phasin